MTKKEIVMYDDPGIVEYRTNIEGWVSKGGVFYGKNEHLARWANCTHKKCECGNVFTKAYNVCEECRTKKDEDKYNALPHEEYNGEPVFSRCGDFFYSEDDLTDHMVDNDLEEIDLYPTYPAYYQQVETDCWSDVIPEDGDIPKELEKALKELNKVISTLGPASYFEDRRKRTSYKLSK